MKKIIGLLIVLVSIALVGLLILKIWDIEIVSLAFVMNGFLSLILLAALLIVLIVCYGFFFRDHTKGYDQNKGNVAHPKF